MLRLLSWSSGLAADKIIVPDVNYLVSQRQTSPSIDLQKTATLKRKRSETTAAGVSPEPTDRHIEDRSRSRTMRKIPPPYCSSPAVSGAMNEQALQTNSPSQSPDIARMKESPSRMPEQARARPGPDKALLRQTLDSQIGLEILLKHKELRLIDQEIAKCQTALEQLRRCSQIPYPANWSSEAISQSQGPSVRSSRSATQSESLAPWGVTDGPYSRHYARWLLPDPQFDRGDTPAGTKTSLNSLGGSTLAQGRATRGSFVDYPASAGRDKIQRAGKFQALSSGYPQPKDKSGPMIQKRKSDGVLVKLICLDCRRDNFSSAQGFINHCRIAHGRNFASHDAAADACGEPVEVDSAGASIAPEGSGTPITGLVHSMIYSAPAGNPDTVIKRSSPVLNVESVPLKTEPFEPPSRNMREGVATKNLSPLPIAPHLSALLQRVGTNVDFQSLVTDVTTPVSVDEPSGGEDEEMEEDRSVLDVPAVGRHPHLTGSMQPARLSGINTSLDARIRGGKGLDQFCGPLPASKSPLIFSSHFDSERSGLATCARAIGGNNIQPSPTTEMNQAPSLMDDDGDDDCEVHSPFYPGSGSSDGENRDFAVDIENGDGDGPSARHPAHDAEFAGTPKRHSGPACSQRASAFRRSSAPKEEKHVSFVSPILGYETAIGSPKRGGDGRRRSGNS